MKFTKINIDTWERKEHFNHYNKFNCSYSLTCDINIGNLLKKINKHSLKLYPVLIYIVTQEINKILNFKMREDKDGCFGYYDTVSPAYLVFHEDTKTFSTMYTEFNDNFEVFYKNIINDIEKAKTIYSFDAIEIPENSFNISCLPWIKYSSVNLNIPIDAHYYAPVITWGKYEKNKNKIQLPFTIQINHAVADGYHTSMLLKNIEEKCNTWNID